jgi:hypothetical protein
MTVWDVKARLGNRGVEIKDVAAKVDPPVDPSMVSHVLHGRKKSERVEEALAEAAGMSVEALRRLLKRAA